MKFFQAILLALYLFLPLTMTSQCRVLIWNDEFEGNQLNSDLWNIEVNDDGGGNNELQYYTSRDTNISVENGFLVITAREENYKTRNYTSGRITTQNKGTFRYGRFEASVKLPEGQGIWPAFWLLGYEDTYGQWPDCGEIDIMEYLGHEPNKVYGSIHTGSPYDHESTPFVLPQGNFPDDYHLFAVEWKEDTIQYFVDDNLYATYTPETVTPWEPFYENFFIILNLAVGGNWPGDPDESTSFPQSMSVDYVRVYGHPSDIEIQTNKDIFPGSNAITFSIPKIKEATYDWTIPNDASIISGDSTHAVTVDWGCNPGQVGLDITTECGDYSYSYDVIFDTLTIEGPEPIYANKENIEFSVPEVDNAAYTWFVPDDATITGGQGTANISVDWGCEPGSVYVEMETACEILYDTTEVEFEPVYIQGPRFVQKNAEEVIYQVNNYPSVNYFWNAPDDATIITGQGSPFIKVNFGEQDGEITVDMTNSCGTKTYSLDVEFANAQVLCDYESVELEFLPFGGAEYEKTENPAPDSVNSTQFVGRFDKSETSWAGIYADLGYELDLENLDEVRMMVNSPVTGTMKFKLEDMTPGTADPVEVDAVNSKTNEWEELTYDFSDLPSGTFDRIALFFDFGTEEENRFYFDHILLKGSDAGDTTTTGWNEQLSTARFLVYPNPVKDKAVIKLKNDLSKATLEVYNFQGQLMREHPLDYAKRGTSYSINFADFSPGAYIIQLTSASGSSYVKVLKK